MNRFQTGALPLLGRLLMAFIFIASGGAKLAMPGPNIGYMIHVGLPMPQLAYAVAVLCELGGGLLILIGWQTRIAAAILAIFCLATAFIAHSDFADMNQMINFMKNICMTGGFLQLVAWGPGAWSIDHLWATRRMPRPA